MILLVNQIQMIVAIVSHYAVLAIVMDMMTKAVQKVVPSVKAAVVVVVSVLAVAVAVGLVMMDGVVAIDVLKDGVIRTRSAVVKLAVMRVTRQVQVVAQVAVT